MAFNCGIVGLPNVGKSTLFNALTATQTAQAANYPFCTIEPNVGRVSVPDVRIEKLSKVANSEKVIPTQLEFVDIAGLVKGASKGEGLGNQFLANIREVDAIVHVLRCFENTDITHVEGNIDPIRDAEIVETELMIADLESMEKRITQVEKKAKSGDKDSVAQVAVMNEVLKALREGKPASSIDKKALDEQSAKIYEQLYLLTSKPVLYVCNVEEENAVNGNAYSDKVKEKAVAEDKGFVLISASIEAEVATLDSEEEQREFLSDLGLEETGLNRIIRTGYALLDLQTYFTVGPKETRAWQIERGFTAPQAAGVIHTDFEKGFIRAETIAYEDYIKYNGESGAKEAGKLRSEGKAYIVKDGDVMHFLFNV